MSVQDCGHAVPLHTAVRVGAYHTTVVRSSLPRLLTGVGARPSTPLTHELRRSACRSVITLHNLSESVGGFWPDALARLRLLGAFAGLILAVAALPPSLARPMGGLASSHAPWPAPSPSPGPSPGPSPRPSPGHLTGESASAVVLARTEMTFTWLSGGVAAPAPTPGSSACADRRAGLAGEDGPPSHGVPPCSAWLPHDGGAAPAAAGALRSRERAPNTIMAAAVRTTAMDTTPIGT